MKLFECQACGQPLYFENTYCESCGRRLGYLPSVQEVTALEPQEGAWTALVAPDNHFRFCANAEYEACNWLILTQEPDHYCWLAGTIAWCQTSGMSRTSAIGVD
jgi:hypothetical protein